MKIKKEAVLGNSTDLGFIYESLSIRKFVVQLSDVQPSNAPSPIDTPFGIFTDVSDSQPANAHLPIDVTVSGIFTDVSDLQL